MATDFGVFPQAAIVTQLDTLLRPLWSGPRIQRSLLEGIPSPAATAKMGCTPHLPTVRPKGTGIESAELRGRVSTRRRVPSYG